MNMTRVRTALLGSGAAIALLAASVPASADDIKDLRSQIDAMKSKIAALEADKSTKRRVAAAAAVEAGDKPKSWKLPGTNTSMQIGGYAKLDILYDFNGFLGTSLGITGVPLRGSTGANRDGNFRLHAQQSRIWVKTWTPTDWGELATHIEADFFNNGGGTTGNPLFRLRHAYGSLGPVLAGRTWTTFMPIFYLAETLDFSGPTGVLFVRQAQLRYTHRLRPGMFLIFAIEDPGNGGAAAQTASGSAIGTGAGTTSGPNFMPDLVAAFHWRHSRGGVYISGLLRGLEVNSGAGPTPGTGFNDRAIGWGVSAAGVWRFGKRFAVGGSLGYGEGQAKYLIGVDVDSVANINAAGTQVNLEPIASFSATAYAQYRWTPTLRSNLVWGYAYQDVADEITGGKALTPAGTDHWNWTLHANLIWSPVPQVNFGIEYIYAFRSVYNANNGVGNRVQIGMQYRF